MLALSGQYTTLFYKIMIKGHYPDLLNKVTITKLDSQKLSPRGVLKLGALRCLRPAALLKKRLRHSCFTVNFTKFFRAPIL